MTIKFSLLICALAATVAHGAIDLVRDGKSDYVIVLRDRALGVEHTAAAELQDYLKQVTGAELAVVSESEAGNKPKIIVRKRNDLTNDAIVIKTVGRDVHLMGAPPRGALYAVYTFLE